MDILKLRDNAVSLSEWRRRNAEIYAQLVREAYVDAEAVPAKIVRMICEELINESNPAAQDSLNAGHIRSQNENILFLAAMAKISPRDFAICITAGFIHDLNKTVGDPLRQDQYAVRISSGRKVRKQTDIALSVGMNHLGNRTRKVLTSVHKQYSSAICHKVIQQIDECIVHHGIGSSRFIQGLFNGENPWWQDMYWDKSRNAPVFKHPTQPPASVGTVVHDLADSAQQMQGDSGWLQKYPFGYWTDSDLSFWQMFWECRPARQIRVAKSLAEQVIIESQTCVHILEEARRSNLLTESQLLRLDVGVHVIAESSKQWLAPSNQQQKQLPAGQNLLSDLSRELGYSKQKLKLELKKLRPSDFRESCFQRGDLSFFTCEALSISPIVAESLSNGPIYWCQE